MTLDELQAIAARVPELERRIAQLEAENDHPSEALGFTLEEVSRRFLPGVPVSTLREWIRDGKLLAHLTPGGRVHLVYMDDLRRFMEGLRSKNADAERRQAAVVSNARRILAKQPKRAV